MLNNEVNILVVDDTMIMREMLRRVLATLGYNNVLQAEHGEAALKVLEQHDYQFGVVFMDIVMPCMDGKTALKKIREKTSTLPVVMLTSVADDESIAECEQSGITRYVLKPVNAKSGVETIGGILEQL